MDLARQPPATAPLPGGVDRYRGATGRAGRTTPPRRYSTFRSDFSVQLVYGASEWLLLPGNAYLNAPHPVTSSDHRSIYPSFLVCNGNFVTQVALAYFGGTFGTYGLSLWVRRMIQRLGP